MKPVCIIPNIKNKNNLNLLVAIGHSMYAYHIRQLLTFIIFKKQ